MRTSDEANLPEPVRRKAVLSGRKYAWRKDDIFAAIEGARSVGLASLGGQVQFVFGSGTCELYWLNFDPADRPPDEVWRDWVERSCDETAAALRSLIDTTDFVLEGRRSFDLVRAEERAGTRLLDHVLFVCYFKSEETT